jgi:hypothetical protein
MRHKASRPLVLQLLRFKRSAAQLLRVGATIAPGRAMVTVVATFGLGIGSYLALDALSGGGTSTLATDPAGSGRSGADHGLEPGGLMSEPDGRQPAVSPSKPDATKSEQSESPSPSATTESPEAGQGSNAPSRPVTSPTPSPLVKEWRDVTPPKTNLSQELPEPDGARFTFSANEPASFGCSLDGAPFEPCTSPVVYSGLEPGWHTFAVKAVDDAGNAERTPAEIRWLVNNGNAPDQ